MLDTEDVRRARYREIIQSLTLMDDIFMTAVFQDSLPCVDLVLQIILEKPNLRATRVVTQDTLKNLHGHDLRLDIHAFADGQEFNIEIQRAKKGAEPRRARYHSSMMDANALPEGADYARLPESYVIFITETDVLGGGQPLYVIERVIRGGGGRFDDGAHIIYVNGAMADTTTPLGRLMHDFRCVRSEEMFYEVLAKQAGAFKKHERGEVRMNAALEKLIEEVSEEKVERARETERLSSIRRMMEKLSVTAEKAMDVLAIPQSEWGRYKAML